MDLTLFTDEEFRKAFMKLDKDGSGYLEISEVRAAEGAGFSHALRTRPCLRTAARPLCPICSPI